MNQREAIIEVKGLSKSFGDKVAVDKVNLTVYKGDIFGFLGPNGSGKTTTIRLLCGLLTADDGEGKCLGYDIRKESRTIKRQVGYMTQRFSFYEDLTIRENLDFVARVYNMKNRRQVVDEALVQLGLEHRQNQLAGDLSGGWKQRLALAACMLHQPKLLLLDEPTAGVDPQARRDFWDEIHRLSGLGITVLVSTHYMDEAERCNRLAYIAYGSLVGEGSPKSLVDDSGLTTWMIDSEDVHQLADELRDVSAAQQVVPFGNTLYVSGTDSKALEQALASYDQRDDIHMERTTPRLEDVFIRLMHSSEEKRW
ncbi:multidrug ABC transporter ATP-binding protein [Hahella sp. CCB-MM4]|uniref:ABC transporter ATP-binding protein n=1 Tax=Hahella sp. (strain CCB-MM4) TaxID=1926491 RepID=UPI000B9BEEF0|nr:ABC transporter ATP-binding protein [Hahella sp. CCB-MM4]OZG74202.1 multidrug ABC transporter ATP-binding protein [Hahella sp. CCB-MM4]